MSPDWVGDCSSFAGRKLRSGVQDLPDLRSCRSTLRPQSKIPMGLKPIVASGMSTTRVWDGSKRFHAFEQLGNQGERIVTGQGKNVSSRNNQLTWPCAWRTRVQHDGWCQGQMQVDTFHTILGKVPRRRPLRVVVCVPVIRRISPSHNLSEAL